jgi:dipeptidyl aminopeptidase/acylaminoacyl peptidase
MAEESFLRRLFALLAISIAFIGAEVSADPGSSAAWSAQATTRVIAEEKWFRSGDAELHGTLYLPQGRAPASLVVVTHGASSPLRSSPLYAHLKEMLPPLGIGVFVYDRRGSGESKGSGSGGDYGLLADDAIAAAHMLAKDPRIDRRRIGLWGLSQGGWIALLAASRSPDIAFAVSASAPVVTPDVQMMFFSANTMRVNGYPQAEIDQMLAMRKAVDDYMRGVGTQAEAQRLVDAGKTKPWFKYLYMGETVRDRAVSGWRKEIEHDPLATLAGIKVPILVLYGAADPVVPVTTSVERLKAVSARLPKMEVAVIAGADHSMQTSVDPKVQLDPANNDAGRPEAPEYFAVLASWLTRQGLTGAQMR